jgi:hypothetical protein
MAGIEDLKSKLIAKNGIAMANQFAVNLPTLDKNTSSDTLNVLCKEVSLPGRQMMSLDRTVGIFQEKVVNGFGVEDVTMTFYVLNDYGVRRYFDEWTKLIYTDIKRGEVNYKNNYTFDVNIRQLQKPLARFGFDIGPFDINLDVGNKSIYSVKLIEAFPTSIAAIPLSNDGQLVECTVQLSYTDYEVIKDERELFDPSININLGGLI